MIDLSALGLAVAQRTSGDKRDQADSSQVDDQDTRKFGDYVNEAGKKTGGKKGADDDRVGNGRVAANDDSDADAIDLTALEEPATVDDFAKLDDPAAAKMKVTKDGAKLIPANTLPQVKTTIDATIITATAPAAEVADDDATDGLAEAKTSFSQGLLQVARLNAASGKVQTTSADAMQAGARSEIKPASSDSKATLAAKLSEPKAADKIVLANPAQELHALLALAEDDVADATDQAAPVSTKKAKSAAEEKSADDLDPTAIDTTAAKAATETVVPTMTPLQHAAAILNVKSAPAEETVAKTDPETDTSKLPAISLDGKVNPDAAEAATAEGKADGAGKTDIVTVLDARRYLGFTNDTAANISANAGALTDAVRGDTSWAQAIQNAKHGGESTATVVNTLKLQMSPEHLGNMTASLRLKGEELSVEVRVETVDAYRQLSGDQDGIVKALQKHGFAIDQVTVQLSPAARADSGQMGGDNSQNNGGNGQSMQDGSQGETARQREDSARRNANQSNWIGNDRTSTSSDSGNGSNDIDAGNLYL